MAENIVYNIDCLEYMRTLPDNYFDLCVADPPYGVKYARGKHGWGVCKNRPSFEDVNWDVKPTKEYFDELQRVSKNQIIWGGQYFTDYLPVSKCWLVWDKTCSTLNKSVFADCELAWTSFTKVCKMFKLRQMGFISDTQKSLRIHPTQKPVELYAWIYKQYAKKGDRIFDPYLGSGSSRIAAYNAELDFVGCEIDDVYFQKQEARFKQVITNMNMFDLKSDINLDKKTLF